jgi:hypothetical protein
MGASRAGRERGYSLTFGGVFGAVSVMKEPGGDVGSSLADAGQLAAHLGRRDWRDPGGLAELVAQGGQFG